ncbi:MAG: hypothetical protein K6U88_13425, partial [Dehalococcoidia bacterium]|nr:hypothetical protein [Dehalococcoidia bacterium]
MNRDAAHAGEGIVQVLAFVGGMVPVLVVAGAAAPLAPAAAIGVLVLGGLIAGYVASRFKVIAQWENAPLMRFGKVRGFAKPGINLIPPFSTIYDRIDMRTRTEV